MVGQNSNYASGSQGTDRTHPGADPVLGLMSVLLISGSFHGSLLVRLHVMQTLMCLLPEVVPSKVKVAKAEPKSASGRLFLGES